MRIAFIVAHRLQFLLLMGPFTWKRHKYWQFWTIEALSSLSLFATTNLYCDFAHVSGFILIILVASNKYFVKFIVADFNCCFYEFQDSKINIWMTKFEKKGFFRKFLYIHISNAKTKRFFVCQTNCIVNLR